MREFDVVKLAKEKVVLEYSLVKLAKEKAE